MRTFCLCVPEAPDRIEKAKAHFAERGVENVEFFGSIHAEIAGLSTSHTYEQDHPGTGFRVGYKITGIWLAHVVLWMHLSRLPDNEFLILEDDAMFQEGWKEKYEDARKHLPDFDFFHIGHCCLLGHPQTIVGGGVVEAKNMQCTHAYVLNKRCIPFLLRTIRKCYAPIDCQLVLEAFPHLRTFALVPRIVDQFNTELPP